MKRTPVSSATLALLVALAGCGDDDPTGVTGDSLTEDEAAALAEVVAGTLFSTYDDTGAAEPGPARVTGTFSVSADVPCELGGEVAVTGNLAFDIDDETQDGTLDYTVTQDHNNCVAESQSGIRFTLNGAPNITADFRITLAGESLTFGGDFGGGVSWARENRSGTCTVAVEFSFSGTLDAESGTASVSGTVCGVSFSENLTFA